jgi:hypothetical protein
VLGDIVGLPFLAAQFIQMIREDRVEAERVDAELDEAAAAAAAEGGAPGEPTPDERPWWEKDSRFADRFRRAQ